MAKVRNVYTALNCQPLYPLRSWGVPPKNNTQRIWRVSRHRVAWPRWASPDLQDPDGREKRRKSECLSIGAFNIHIHPLQKLPQENTPHHVLRPRVHFCDRQQLRFGIPSQNMCNDLGSLFWKQLALEGVSTKGFWKKKTTVSCFSTRWLSNCLSPWPSGSELPPAWQIGEKVRPPTWSLMLCIDM